MGNILLNGVRSRRGLRAAAAVAIATLFAAGFSIAAPPAGTSIGNQASATYTDSSAVPRTVTSGTVTTIVQQVAGLDLAGPPPQLVSPGGTVNFPHTLTNTGNGADIFTLAATDANTGNIAFASLKIYPDANADGVPDSFTEITNTGSLAAGGIFHFVVAATVPGSAAATDAERVFVTATSQYVETPADLVVSATNNDDLTVTGSALINLTKAASASSGPSPFGPITYTLTYTNTGNSTATAVTITDTLAAGISPVADSGLWSVTGGTVLTSANDGVQPPAGTPNIAYSVVGSTVTAVISSINKGQSGTVSFQVTIGAGLAPGVLNNTALISYDDGTGIQSGSSNTVGYTVNQTAGVLVDDNPSTTDANGPNDVVYTASAVQGAIVPFDVVIHNTGNGTDSFTVVPTASSFPPGTTFLFYQAGGFTPLVGGVTPPVAAGGAYHVVVKAILPSGATGSGPFNLTFTGTSAFNPAVADATTVRLGTISSSTVDLTNNTARDDSAPAGLANAGNAAATGWGAGPEAPYVVSNPVNPGTSTTFQLYVNNTSAVADGYDLAASANSGFSASLPAGWTAVFKADGGSGDCSTTGATITATGVVTAGANRLVCAVVGVPAGAVAGPTAVYFRALSATTGAGDSIHDQVAVNAVRSIVVAPPNPGQVFPGGTVTYTHTVTNSGNVTEGSVAGAGSPNGTNSIVSLGTTESTDPLVAVWTSVVYWDRNNNGTLDGGDPVVTDLSQLTGGTGGASTAAGLDPGETARLFVKVFAPAGASSGDVNVTTLRAGVSGTISSVAAPAAATTTDTTTVIAGQVRLDKLQALDAACDGTADTAFSSADITTGALPGACIRYQITAINDGTGDVTVVVVSDATPANTTLNCGLAAAFPPATTFGGPVTAPGCGATGTVQATIGTLTPSQQAVVTFGVKIDP